MIGKSYILTGANFDGEIEFVYDEKDRISAFEIRADLSDAGIQRVFDKFPITTDGIAFFEQQQNITILQVPEDLSFDTFWENWCGKQANKERAKLLWDKMTKKNKVRCLWSLKAYKRYIERNAHWYNSQYPDSYLSPKKSGWLNDYNKM